MSHTWADVRPGDKVTVEVTKTVAFFHEVGDHLVAEMVEDEALDSGSQWRVLGTLADDRADPIKTIERPTVTFQPVETSEEDES